MEYLLNNFFLTFLQFGLSTVTIAMRLNGGINGLALSPLKLVSWVKTLVQHLSDILELRINIGADLV